MEAQPSQSSPTPIAEIGSLARAVEAERAGRYVVAWQEALKAIAVRPFHPEAYIQMASTAKIMMRGYHYMAKNPKFTKLLNE
jgi:hypothetical protein